MGDAASVFSDPAFQKLLRKRSRLRWSFASIVVGAYMAFGICGLLAPAAYARLVFGESISLGLLLGYLVIATSIALSLIYVRAVNRLEGAHRADGIAGDE